MSGMSWHFRITTRTEPRDLDAVGPAGAGRWRELLVTTEKDAVRLRPPGTPGTGTRRGRTGR